MTEQDMASQQEIWNTFKDLSVMLDTNLQLSPDPRHPKRRKDQPKANADEVTRSAKNPVQLAQMMQVMVKLLLRHEQEIQHLHRTDTFLLLCNKEQTGVAWKQKLETQTLPLMPLRQHLFHTLLKALLNRISQISKCPLEDKVIQTLIGKGLLLEDLSWPFQQWDAKQKLMVKGPKKAISMKKMVEDVTELVEMARSPTLITRFHALPQKEEAAIVPWKLQMNMRDDPPWDLMLSLCQNSVWTLLGTNLKCHSQSMSGLAVHLQNLIRPSQTQGKGKDKGKSKGKGR